MNTSPAPGSGLNKAAGIAMVVIAVTHVVFTMNPFWPQWISGALRDRTADAESMAAFWAQPGGFAAVLLLLGLLINHMARNGQRPPSYCGWLMLGWIGLCLVLIGPASGFVLGLVPSGLLIAASIRGAGTDRVDA
ncbi:DUF6463 family protein [Stackebrandtia soli]|uniref:DUF6463 family protein n=1 Tax=Stackebrandtia soli TaxID=1892856 RepID=UPI0039EB8F67